MNDQNPLLPKLYYSFLLFSLFFYSYIYFFSFEQGVSQAPILFPIARDFLFFSLISAFFLNSLDKLRFIRNFEFLGIFIGFIILTTLLKPSFFALKESKNIVLYSSVFLIAGSFPKKDLRIPILAFLILQILFSYFGSLYDIGWGNRKICGTLGNPVILSIFLNILIFASLLQKKLDLFHYSVFILSLGLLLFTRASGSIVIFLALFFFVLGYLGLQKKFKEMLILFMIALGTIAILESMFDIIYWHFWILFYNKIINFLGLSQFAIEATDYMRINNVSMAEAQHLTAGGSDSISDRAHQLQMAIHFLKDFPNLHFWIGSKDYFAGDIQYINMLLNHGFIGFSLFLGLLSKMIFNSIRHRHFLYFTLTLLFALSFIFYRILYYFPVNMFFFILCYYVLVELPKKSARRR